MQEKADAKFAHAHTSGGFQSILTLDDRIGVATLGCCRHRAKENDMGLGTIILVILVLALLGVLPSWPHSRSWGYGPSGGVGLVVVVLLVLVLMGHI